MVLDDDELASGGDVAHDRKPLAELPELRFAGRQHRRSEVHQRSVRAFVVREVARE
jgi:hypothetical protein